MVKRQNMASGDHTIPGNPAEYFEMTSGGGDVGYPTSDTTNRSAGGRIIKQPLPYGGTPAMYGVQIDYPNSNVDGIRNSINDGQSRNPQGANGATITAHAPMRHPVNGINPMKPIKK